MWVAPARPIRVDLALNGSCPAAVGRGRWALGPVDHEVRQPLSFECRRSPLTLGHERPGSDGSSLGMIVAVFVVLVINFSEYSVRLMRSS